MTQTTDQTTDQTTGNDIYWVHCIRAMAVMSVVLLHSAAQVLQLDVPYASLDWWVGNSIDSALRMSVPLLFMITGFLLVGKREPLKIFFNKRFGKIIIPLLVWSTVYICWLVFVEAGNPTPISPYSQEIIDDMTQGFPVSLLRLLLAPAYYHLWFMYALIGVYLCLPLLRLLVQQADRQMLWYFIALWIPATFVFPWLHHSKIYVLIELKMVSGHIGYLVLGYLLGTMPLSKKLFIWMWPLFVVSVTITAVGTWWLSSAEALNQTFYSPVPNVLGMTISSFIILRYLGENSVWLQSARIKPLILQCSTCAFGIYLVHALFLFSFHKGLFGFTLDAVQGNALVFIPLTAIVVYLVSFAVVLGLRKVPYLRAAVP